MSLSHRKHRVAAAVTAAVVVVGGGSAAVAAAAAPATARTASVSAATTTAALAGSTSAHAGKHHRGLLARADHATIELKVKGQWATFALDRGTVTAISSGAISLQRPDGASVTLQINSATHFRGLASSSTVKTGAKAAVISENGVARRVATQVSRPKDGGHKVAANASA